MKDVEPLPVTLITGGLNKEMEGNFRSFLKSVGISAELNLHAIGNPDAEIKASGLDLVKVKQYLGENNWWYKTK